MSRNAFDQCAEDYNRREDAIAMAKAERDQPMIGNFFTNQCEQEYKKLQDAIETSKYEREQMNLRDFELTKQHLTSDAFLHELWALAQGDPIRDAVAAMRAFIEKNLR